MATMHGISVAVNADTSVSNGAGAAIGIVALDQPGPLSTVQYRIMFEQSPDPTLVSNDSGEYLDANVAALDLLGYSREELHRLRVEDVVIPGPNWTAEVQARSVRNGRWRSDVEVRIKSGVSVPMESRTVVLTGPGGALHVSVLRDLTERTRNDMTRTRMAALVQSSADAIVGKTLDGIITDWNQAAERLYGYAAKEAIGQPVEMLAPPERVHEIYTHLARARRGESIEEIETVRCTKDGSLINVSLTIWPVRNEADQIVAAAAIARDITERKAAEVERATTYQQTRRMLEGITDPCYALDREWRFTYVNDAAEKMLGRSGNELLNTNIWEEFPDTIETPLYSAYHQAVANGIMTTAEFFYPSLDAWFEVRAYPSKDGVSVVLHDITARKQLEQELHEALDAAQAGIRSKNHFLAMMGHELRTPLQAVLGYADFLLADQYSSLTPEQAEDIGYIHRGAGRMVTLIEQLLELSRMEAGRLELAAEPVDLADIIEQVRQDIAPQAAVKMLDVQIDVPPSLPQLHGDPSRLRQILLNLAANAVKFTDEGAVRIEARATDDGVDVAVSDTGIGIPEAAMPHIFEEFRQLDNGTSRRHDGAGLGLAISKQLAELMGGRIQVESRPEGGSTFTLHLIASHQFD